MEKYYKNKVAYIAFLLPAICIFLFTVITPIIWSAGYSLFEWDGITDMEFVGLKNFVKMLTDDAKFWQVFSNNLIYVAVNAFVQPVFGLLIAILLTNFIKGREFIKTMYFTPAILSSIAISQLFARVLSVEPLGLVNYLLTQVGLEQYVISWTSSPDYALLVVSTIEGYRYIGLYMIILYSALISIPTDIIEAATIDGAHGFKMFSRIKFPLIKGVFGVTVVMIINGTMKGFDIPYILTGGGPAGKTELIATYMYKTAFLTSQFGYGSAMAVFLAIECFVMVSLIRKIYT